MKSSIISIFSALILGLLYFGCSEDENDKGGGVTSNIVSGKFLILPKGQNFKIFAYMGSENNPFMLGEAPIKADSTFSLTLSTPPTAALTGFNDDLGGNCRFYGSFSPLEAKGNTVFFGMKRNDTILPGYVFITKLIAPEREPDFLVNYFYTDRNFTANGYTVCVDTPYPGYVNIDTTYYQINAPAGYNKLVIRELRRNANNSTVLVTTNMPSEKIYFYFITFFKDNKSYSNKTMDILRVKQEAIISNIRMQKR